MRFGPGLNGAGPTSAFESILIWVNECRARTNDYGRQKNSSLEDMGETYVPIGRFFSLRVSHHNVITSYAGCTGGRVRGNGRASRLRMRTGYDKSCRCVRGQNYQTPSPQVRGVGCRDRLPSVAIILRCSTASIEARPTTIVICGPQKKVPGLLPALCVSLVGDQSKVFKSADAS
jgi:hypothetical protein